MHILMYTKPLMESGYCTSYMGKMTYFTLEAAVTNCASVDLSLY